MEGLSQKPRYEKNGTYCSPACGRGCTERAYTTAVAKADLLAETLGSGWVPKVWENLGWHYAARSPCDRLSVHSSYGAGFSAYLNEPGSVGGRWAEHGDTPQEAIDATVAAAVADYKRIGAIIEGLA